MPTVRFALNNEDYARLENDARHANMSIQNYVRFKLFNKKTIFSVDEAVRRIENGNFENIEFSLPDVYGDEWTITRDNGAGALGKNFFYHITKYPELGIRRVSKPTKTRHAIYTYKKV